MYRNSMKSWPRLTVPLRKSTPQGSHRRRGGTWITVQDTHSHSLFPTSFLLIAQNHWCQRVTQRYQVGRGRWKEKGRGTSITVSYIYTQTHYFQPSFLANSVIPASESDTERYEVDYDTVAESLVGPICRKGGRGRGAKPANENNPDPSEPHPDPPKQQLPPPPLLLGIGQTVSSLTVAINVTLY